MEHKYTCYNTEEGDFYNLQHFFFLVSMCCYLFLGLSKIAQGTTKFFIFNIHLVFIFVFLLLTPKFFFFLKRVYIEKLSSLSPSSSHRT